MKESRICIRTGSGKKIDAVVIIFYHEGHKQESSVLKY